MKGNKLLPYAFCGIIAVAAAVTAIYFFRNEIAYFFVDIKEKIEERKLRRNGEYTDYADI